MTAYDIQFSCLLLLLGRKTVIKCINKNNSLYALPPKKPNRFLLFIKKLLNIIFSKRFLYSSFIIFSTGLLGRYLILTYLEVNVFTDIFNPISISFYALLSGYAHVVRELFSHLTGNILMKMNVPGAGGAGAYQGAGAAGGAGANQGAGNLRMTTANRINGPIQPADPNGQGAQYNANTNQPLLGNIARELDRQSTLGLTSLTRFVFTPNHEQLVLS